MSLDGLKKGAIFALSDSIGKISDPGGKSWRMRPTKKFSKYSYCIAISCFFLAKILSGVRG